MHIFVHNQLKERLTPGGAMNIRVSHETLRRDSSFITLEVARWMWSIFAGANKSSSDETMNCSWPNLNWLTTIFTFNISLTYIIKQWKICIFSPYLKMKRSMNMNIWVLLQMVDLKIVAANRKVYESRWVKPKVKRRHLEVLGSPVEVQKPPHTLS